MLDLIESWNKSASQPSIFVNLDCEQNELQREQQEHFTKIKSFCLADDNANGNNILPKSNPSVWQTTTNEHKEM